MKGFKWFPTYRFVVNLNQVMYFNVEERGGLFALFANFVNGDKLILDLNENRESCEDIIDEVLGIENA